MIQGVGDAEFQECFYYKTNACWLREGTGVSRPAYAVLSTCYGNRNAWGPYGLVYKPSLLQYLKPTLQVICDGGAGRLAVSWIAFLRRGRNAAVALAGQILPLM